MANIDKLLFQLLRSGRLEMLKLLGRAVGTVTVLIRDNSDKILLATGTTVPSDSTAGYAKGCIFIDTDVGAGSQGLYINVGTTTACNFDACGTIGALSVDTGNIVDDAVTLAKLVNITRGSIIVGGVAAAPTELAAKTSGQILVGDGTDLKSVAVSGDATLSAAGALTIGAAAITSSKLDETTIQYAAVALTKTNILDTGAGGLGHANGFPLVAAPTAGKVLELLSATLIFDYATAAYDGGGNVSVGWAGGGGALTGVVTFANSIGASADKIVRFSPTTTAGVALTAATGINLLCAAAPTDTGGTAAGVVRVKVAYRVHTTGL